MYRCSESLRTVPIPFACHCRWRLPRTCWLQLAPEPPSEPAWCRKSAESHSVSSHRGPGRVCGNKAKHRLIKLNQAGENERGNHGGINHPLRKTMTLFLILAEYTFSPSSVMRYASSPKIKIKINIKSASDRVTGGVAANRTDASHQRDAGQQNPSNDGAKPDTIFQ